MYIYYILVFNATNKTTTLNRKFNAKRNLYSKFLNYLNVCEEKKINKTNKMKEYPQHSIITKDVSFFFIRNQFVSHTNAINSFSFVNNKW